MKLNLKMNVTPIPKVVIQFHFESMLTLVSSPDLDPILELTIIPVPIDFEYEPLILDSHILLLGNECKLEFYDLDQTHEPTLTLEPKLDLSFILESVLVPISFIVELKLSFHKITFHCWTKV